MTTTYAALLRGINVSGHKRVPMPELRTVPGELEHSGAVTHLQSGNAVFRSDSEDEGALGAALEQAPRERSGLSVSPSARANTWPWSGPVGPGRPPSPRAAPTKNWARPTAPDSPAV